MRIEILSSDFHGGHLISAHRTIGGAISGMGRARCGDCRCGGPQVRVSNASEGDAAEVRKLMGTASWAVQGRADVLHRAIQEALHSA